MQWDVEVDGLSLSVQLFDLDATQGLPQMKRGPLSMWAQPVEPANASSHALLYNLSEQPIAVSSIQLREQSEYILKVEVKKGGDVLPSLACFPALHYPILRVEPIVREGKQLSARLNFRDYVGYATLSIEVEGRTLFRVDLEVRSKKLGYLDEYVAILDELAAQAAGLVLRLESPVRMHFRQEPLETRPKGRIEFFLLLRHFLHSESFESAIEWLIRYPHRHLSRTKRDAQLGRHVVMNSRELDEGVRRGGPSTKIPMDWSVLPNIKRLPLSFVREEVELALENPENIFVLQFFLRRQEQLMWLKQSFQKRRWNGLVMEIERLEDRLSSFHARLPFSTLEARQPIHTQALQQMSMRRGYRELVDIEEQLTWGLSLVWNDIAEAIAGPIRDLAQLYEMWCFFALYNALKDLTDKQTPPPVLQLDTDGWKVMLPKGHEKGLSFSYKELEIRLYYQRRFTPGIGTFHSYSVALTPDYTLECVTPSGEVCLICFDAKYRADSALEKMHAYRDALRGAAGAYLFYPGDQQEPTLFHLDALRPFPGVGAFPLRPHSESLRWLFSFLQFIFEHLLQTDSLTGKS